MLKSFETVLSTDLDQILMVLVPVLLFKGHDKLCILSVDMGSLPEKFIELRVLEKPGVDKSDYSEIEKLLVLLPLGNLLDLLKQRNYLDFEKTQSV